MRKSFLISVVFALMLVILAGCGGVSQEEYDELEQAAVTEIENLESEFEATLAEYEAEFEVVIADYEAQFAAAGIEYDSEVENFSEIVHRMGLKYLIVGELFMPTFTGDDLDNASTIDRVRGYVEELGDAVMESKFDAWAASPSDQDLAVLLLEYALESLEEDLGELG